MRDGSYFYDDSAGDTALGLCGAAYLRVLLRSRSGSFGYHDKSYSQFLPLDKFKSAALPAPFVLLLGQRRGSRYIDPVLRTVFDGELEDNVADMGDPPDSQRRYVHPRADSARRRRG